MVANWQFTFIQAVFLVCSLAILFLVTITLRRTARGSLGRQLLLAFISVALIALLPIFTIIAWQIRNTLTEQTGKAFTVMAEANSRRLGEELSREIGLLQNLSEDEALFARIAATSDTLLAPMPEAERETLLRTRDRAWKTGQATELVEDTVENSASRQLQEFIGNFPEFYQILLTDRFSSLVATAGVESSDYYFSEADWWQAAWHSPDFAAVFLQAVPGLPGAAEAEEVETAVQIAFPIRAPFTTVPRGVLQTQLHLADMETLKDALVPENSGQMLLIAKPSSEILYSSDTADTLTLPPDIFDQIEQDGQTWHIYEDEQGEPIIYSSAALYAPPDQDALTQLDWYIVVQQKQNEALATVNRLIFIALTGGMLALLLAFLVGRQMTRRLTRPIVDLTAIATAMADGDLERTATPSGPTEFQALAGAFNRMTHQLRQSLGELEQEVDERRQIEEKLQAYTAELERSNRELQEFAYAASHDLQEPLRKIQTFSNRLEEKYADALDERGRDYLARMQDAAVRMQTLIIDLLHYSRVTTRAQPFEPVQLNEIVQGVISDLETRIEEVSGEVRVGNLPEIEADQTQMRQLFQNLIGNALKFHQEDRPPVVEVSGEINSAGKSCHIWVRDNGIGFDPAYDERIFALFQRLHGRQEYEGTGIGLAVCRKIVDRHGGTIKAESQPGEGATFTITLPISQ